MKNIRTILLTTDLSDASKRAAEATSTLARKFGAKVIVTFVGDLFLPLYSEPFTMGVNFEPFIKEAHERARQQLAEFAETSLGPEIAVETQSPAGVPHIEIVKLAKERQVDLIVMAPHGRGFLSHAILGSTTDRVLRHAPCPVLVVRGPEHD